jgi:hypothetical protein
LIMRLLPVDEWLIEFTPTNILVAAHAIERDMHWTKYELADFCSAAHRSRNLTENFIGLDDLKRIVTAVVVDR